MGHFLLSPDSEGTIGGASWVEHRHGRQKMKSLLYAAVVLILGSSLMLAQTTSQQDSPASNSTAGTYSGNTPANAPASDGTISNAPTTAPADARSNDIPREHNWGWIGILGLAGLAGLRNRNRESYGSPSRRAAA